VTTRHVFPQVFVSDFRQSSARICWVCILCCYISCIRYVTLTVGGVCKKTVIPCCGVFFTVTVFIVRVIKSRSFRWAGHVERVGEGRGMFRVLVGKPEGRRPFGRRRRKLEDNIKMGLQEVGGGGYGLDLAGLG
jgi:hypothetical protein